MVIQPELYSHQTDMVDRLRKSIAKHRASILQAPPGTGKTRIAKWMLGTAANREPKPNQTGKSLFAVHRRGLVDNASNSFNESPALPHGILMSGVEHNASERVQVASIDTLLSWFCEGGYNWTETFDLVCFDECHSHHQKLATFLKAHNAKREELGLSMPYVIGLSATPQAQGLADIYQEIVRGPETQWLIDQGFLSPYRYFRATQGKLGLLVKRGDEYTKDSVSSAMEGLSGDLVRDWKKFAEGRATVGFFPRRTHAKEAQEALCAAGIKAEYVDGETDDDRRNLLYKWLNNGDIEYLCNVGVVERGTDIPRIGCVQMCTAVGNLVRWCLDPKTEVLTPDGWKGIDDRYDSVYQVSEDGRCTVTNRFERTEQKVSGVEFWGIENRSLSICVSENHRMLIKERRHKSPRVELSQDVPAEFAVPINALEASEGVPLSDAEIRFIGLVATDGTIGKDNWQIKIYQSERHPECIDYIEDVLDECCFRWSRYLHKGGSGDYTERHKRYVYTVSFGNPSKKSDRDAGLSGWGRLLPWMGKNPAASLADCTREQLLVLLEAMRVGDGDKMKSPSINWTPKTWRLAIANTEHAESLQSLCVRRGVRCNISDNGCGLTVLLIDTSREWWTVTRNASDGRPNWGKMEAPGRMWCLTVPSGFLIARRDGKPFVVGNCQMIGRGSRVHPDVPDCLVLDHGGGIAKHGFFEDSIPWTLDWSVRPSKEHLARPKIECPKCSAVYRGGKCSNCGYEPSRGERRSQGLEFDGSELQEVKRKDRKQSTTQQSNEQIMVSALFKMRNKTWRQALRVAFITAEAQGTQFRVPKRFEVGGRVYKPIPYGSTDSSRRVRDLYDFV